MLFNSLEFAIFFIVATMYFILPQRLRTPHLLVSSCIFYMAFIPAYIVILALTIAIDYTAGIYLGKVAGRARSWLLAASVIATCLVLFVFKYFSFFTNNAIGLVGLFGWQLSGPVAAPSQLVSGLPVSRPAQWCRRSPNKLPGAWL